MKNQMKKEIKELLLACTAYGVSNLFRSKNLFSKILWIFFLFLSATGSCFYIYDAISTYLSHEIVTVIETQYEQPTQFPTVTLCSGDKYFNGKNLTELIMNDENSRFGYDFDIKENPDDHFETFINQEYGKCFRFNSGKNISNHSILIKNSTVGGQDDSFTLNINSPETCETKKCRIYVWIHSRTLPPKIESFNNLEKY